MESLCVSPDSCVQYPFRVGLYRDFAISLYVKDKRDLGPELQRTLTLELHPFKWRVLHHADSNMDMGLLIITSSGHIRRHSYVARNTSEFDIRADAKIIDAEIVVDLFKCMPEVHALSGRKAGLR